MIKKYNEFIKETYNDYVLDFVNTYYSDETGDMPYGDYDEILNRVNNFYNTDFPYGLNNLPEEVILYRLLNVDGIDDINKQELGKSYVGDKEMFKNEDFLESFLFRYGEKMKEQLSYNKMLKYFLLNYKLV
jgi:hypothetical protein